MPRWGPGSHLSSRKAEEPLVERVFLWQGKPGRVPRRYTACRKPLHVLEGQLSSGCDVRAAPEGALPRSRKDGSREWGVEIHRHPGTDAERLALGNSTGWAGRGPPYPYMYTARCTSQAGKGRKWKCAKDAACANALVTYGEGLRMGQKWELTVGRQLDGSRSLLRESGRGTLWPLNGDSTDSCEYPLHKQFESSFLH